MLPMAMAAMIVVASSAVNVTIDVGLNTIQNWSDALYLDAFWGRRDVASPELDHVLRDDAEIARLIAGPGFAVGPTASPDLITQGRR